MNIIVAQKNHAAVAVVSLLALFVAACPVDIDSPVQDLGEPTEEVVVEPPDDLCEPATKTGNGLPFLLAPGLSAAGFGLNTNDDGQQNYGEVGIDCGGAGAKACIDIDLDVVIETDTLLDPSRYSGYRLHLAEGTLNGHVFQMIYPEPDQEGLVRDNAGVVVEWPTRHGTHHQAPAPYRLEDLVPGQELGATAIAFEGPTGGHPYVFSTQLAALAARYLREVRGLDTIIVTGASYGAAAALVDAALYPELFDGAFAYHAPYDGRAFIAWSEFGGLRFAGGGLPIIDPLFYPGLDGMGMAAAQAGLTMDNLDLTRLGNTTVPTIVVLGEFDPVWYPGAKVAADLERMADEGIDWVRIKNIPEAQHGGPESSQAALESPEELFVMIDERRAAGLENSRPLCKSPRQRFTGYDEVMRSAPRRADDARVEELWSDVTLLEPGWSGSAVYTDQDTLYTGSLQGFLTRRSWSNGSFVVEWSVPVGRSIEAIDRIENTLIVGSKRGIALIDAESGALVRETLDIGTVTDVEIGDLIPEEPGLEIAARADQDMLHVESLETGATLSATVVGSGGTMRWTEVTGEHRLLVPLLRGHVAGMRFVGSADTGWVPEADWLSDYLVHQVTAIEIVRVAGEDRIVAAGNGYGGPPSLYVLDETGRIADVIESSIPAVESMARWTDEQLLVAGRGGIMRIDLADGSVNPWPNDGTHVATSDLDADGQLEAIAFAHSPTGTPAIVVRDAAGSELWGEVGRETSPAMDLRFIADQGIWELSVMGRDWSIDRFDLATGEALGEIASLKPQFTNMVPRRLVRHSDAAEAASYEPFLFDGDVLGEGPVHVRVGTRCGGWVASSSIAEEQLTLRTAGDGYHDFCATAESNGTLPAGIAGLISERIGSAMPNLSSSSAGGLRFVDIIGPYSHAVMTTAGGQVALFKVEGNSWESFPIPELVVDIAGTQTSLAAGQGEAGAVVAVGSWLRNDAGYSLQLLEASTLTVLAEIDAGYVLGTALADLDGDGIDEILVGTEDGWLRAYSTDLELLLEWSVGDLNVGENGALFAAETEDGTMVVFAVAGGWRVLKIAG